MRGLLVLASAALFVVGSFTQEIPEKQLFHVEVDEAVLDQALTDFGDELDVWKVERTPDQTIRADIYATEEVISKFYTTTEASRRLSMEEAPLIDIVQDAVDMPRLLEDSTASNTACVARTAGHLQSIANATDVNYTDNAFFDCWRTADEVFAFMDALVAENAAVFSKISSVATTVEKRSIPAYVLSTGPGKKAIYVQGLIHAREWHAGSSGFYTIAALLDGLRANDSTIVSIVDKYDWYFVPILNLDGFLFTHAPTGNRFWRKNRRPTVTAAGKPAFGVDLNRNFGPIESFNKTRAVVSADTYPGPYPLSEPETAGIFAWLATIPLVGALDLHAYSSLVLRPFGFTSIEAPEPFGSRLKTLGDNVRDAIQRENPYPYTSQTASDLYTAYGTFMDAVFVEFNNTPCLSFEMEGKTFIPDASVIRPGGQHIYQGVVQFAMELKAYYADL